MNSRANLYIPSSFDSSKHGAHTECYDEVYDGFKHSQEKVWKGRNING